MLGGHRLNDRFWEQTLANLARSLGVAEPVVETTKVCVDRRRQWRYVAQPAAQRRPCTWPSDRRRRPSRWVRRRRAAS